MNLTQSQLDAIRHRGSNLLVAASAGSGKTEVLARRCAAIIADPQHPCGIDRLLVVTFTRAAAAELRARIAAMLRREAEQTSDARLARHVRRQELMIDTADIGTIDAWCARLVRENVAVAGVDPAFAIVGADDAAILHTQTLDRLFDAIYSDPAADETEPVAQQAAARAWLKRAARPSDAFLRASIRRLHTFREHLVDPAAWFARQAALANGTPEGCRAAAEDVLRGALAQEISFQAEQLVDISLAGTEEFARGQVALYQAALEGWFTKLRGSVPVLDVVRSIENFEFARWKGKDEIGRRLRDEIKKKWLNHRLRKPWSLTLVERILGIAGRTAELMGVLLALEAQYDGLLRQEKAQRGAYEFGDVLRMTLNLLRDDRFDDPESSRRPSGIALALRARYEHVLVDEYQDTSPVQVELLRLVSRDEPGRTNRLLVGDVKQSIYGFREAEPRLFVELARALDEGRQEGRVQPLADNFRSHRGVLDPLNAIFERLFDPALGGTTYGEHERLVARRAEIENPTLDGSPRVELHVIEEDRATRAAALHQATVDAKPSEQRPDEDDADADDSADEEFGQNQIPPDDMPIERIEREAKVAAGRIRELIANRVRVLEQRKDQSPRLREMRLADVVILLRSAAGNAALLAAALRRLGVPSIAVGRESLLESQEVRDVRHALALLVNRRQDLPLAAFLRGPLGGLSEQDLVDIRACSSERGYAAAVRACLQGADAATLPENPPLSPLTPGPASGLPARLAKALKRLDEWEILAREAGLPDVVRRILSDGGVKLFAQALPAGEHRVGMLDALEAMAADFAETGGGVAEFVEHLDSLEELELRPSTASAGGGDAVRVMTIHASKGLEFPVVLLLNAGAEFSRRRRDAGLLCDEKLGIGLRFFDYPARIELESAARGVIARQTVQREREEELRLLYVAATRAREKLIVVGHWQPDKWAECRAIYAVDAAIPLMRRFNAAHTLEWVAMGTAASGMARETAAMVCVTLHSAGALDGSETPDSAAGAAPPPPGPPPSLVADERWIDQAVRFIMASPDRSLSETPALLSVSRVKQSLFSTEDREARPRSAMPQTLAGPRFAQVEAQPDRRISGTVAHRFLMMADLRRIAAEPQVREQIEELVRAGRLTRMEAELVPAADIAWFGGAADGRRLAAHFSRARREMPFLYAIPVRGGPERVLLRGIIDCLIETDKGLEILDYKTDQPRNPAEWRERIDGYSVQLGLYALAAAGLLGRPVTLATLVFLSARRVESVDVSEPRQRRLLERIPDVGLPDTPSLLCSPEC